MINITEKSNLTSSRKDGTPKQMASRYTKIKYVKTHILGKTYRRDSFRLKKYNFWTSTKYSEAS